MNRRRLLATVLQLRVPHFNGKIYYFLHRTNFRVIPPHLVPPSLSDVILEFGIVVVIDE